jgi:tetratricopeptide (TPR) repeat protein
MTEEVIRRLSMIRGLRVISRTSVMQFKDTQLSAPEIARKLGVDALVEGSVIREGNRIRIHAQLIRASWARRARDLDPLGPSGHTIGWTLFNAHRYDEAIREFRNALAARPDNVFPLAPLGWALFYNHQAEDAIRVWEQAAAVTDRSPGVIGTLIWAYALTGRRADALRLLAELKKRQQTGYVPAGAFVSAYLGLGDNDEAFAWHERAYQEQSNILIYIKVFPPFDPLRGDPRFQDLVRRVGLN